MDGELIDGWRLHQHRRGNLENSIQRRSAQVRSFARWLDAPLANATEEQVDRFLDQRRTRSGQPISARTRYTWISTLHCFYEWAVRAGHATADPTRDIIRPKLRKTLPRPITDDDLDVAIRLATGQTRCWLVLAAYAGLRCAEIAGLHRDDVIRDANLLRIVGKGEKERLVPMHPLVLAELDAYPKPRTNTVIFERPGGSRWPDALLSRYASVYLHDIGIDATLHQLRHWFGTRTLMACDNLRTVQELFGHSSPTTTAIYTAFSNDDAAAAVLSLGPRQNPQGALW